MTAPLPANEDERLQELERYGILDTSSEKAFDDITRLAAQICGTPIAYVTLIDRERQWFKSRFGMDLRELPRDLSICTHTILTPDLTQIPDISLDPRFQDSSFIAGGSQVRFYAGAPLVARGGHVLGTLCVVDHSPRTLSAEQREALEDLSQIVVAQLELRRTVAEREQALQKQAQASDALRERERQLQTITDNVPLLIARVAPDCRYTFANREYQDILRIPADQIIGHTMHEVLGESAFKSIRAYVDRALAGERVAFTSWIDFRTVGLRHTDANYIPEFGPDGEVVGFLVTVMDITGRKHAEIALRERTALLENVLSTIPYQVFWKNRDSVYLGCNPNFAQAVGLSAPAEILGKSDLDLPRISAQAEQYRRKDQVVMETGTASLDQEEDFRLADGTVTAGLTSKVPLRDAEGHIIGVLGISQDVSERKALEAEREHLLEEMERLLVAAVDQADRDPLTGLINHRTFHKRLEEETSRAGREGMPLAVVMLDLDNFKFFNDTYGHPAGDDVLRRVAAGLARFCRPCDAVARFGGDRFTLLMPGLDLPEATRLTQRIIAGLDQQGYVPPGHDVTVPLSLSSGIGVFPIEVSSRQEVLNLAAARLRFAKTGGNEALAEALNVRAVMSRRVEGFSMLDSLVVAVDNKDRYTRHHSEDVLAYSLDIAKQLGLDDKAQKTVAVAALLHDVGKIGVPDAILRKPGKLTAEEFQAMQQHPMMGAIIVGAVPGFEETLDAVRHHHERWDGGGYPFGLRGEETPLTARLMAVADAFSAMTTDRPYRKGMPEAKALSILQGGAGSQWDPTCVHAFLQTRSHDTAPQYAH